MIFPSRKQAGPGQKCQRTPDCAFSRRSYSGSWRRASRQRPTAPCPSPEPHHGRPHGDAYSETAAAWDKIDQAFLALNLQKKEIATQALTLDGVDFEGKSWTPREREERQLGADQQWKVHGMPRLRRAQSPGRPPQNRKLLPHTAKRDATV